MSISPDGSLTGKIPGRQFEAKIYDDIVRTPSGATSSICENGMDGVDEIPWDSLCRVGAIVEEGRAKHGAGNWLKAVGDEKFIYRRLKHAARHIWKYLNGDRSEDHLAKAVWGLLFMMELQRLTDKKRLEDLRLKQAALQQAASMQEANIDALRRAAKSPVDTF